MSSNFQAIKTKHDEAISHFGQVIASLVADEGQHILQFWYVLENSPLYLDYFSLSYLHVVSLLKISQLLNVSFKILYENHFYNVNNAFCFSVSFECIQLVKNFQISPWSRSWFWCLVSRKSPNRFVKKEAALGRAW